MSGTNFTARLTVITITCSLIVGCRDAPPAATSVPQKDPEWQSLRHEMVQSQLKRRDISDDRVLSAMERVPRHAFVPPEYQSLAYEDTPLPIGHEQTISQPYIVAFMTEAARLEPNDRVLEIGTGSGYQAAVLAEIVKHVYTIELLPELAEQARARLMGLNYKNVSVRSGDGYAGWPEEAPFDAILVTCGADEIPQPLVEQLKPGGRMIIPVGTSDDQSLNIIEKGTNGQVREERAFPVRFVPLRRK